MFSRAAPGKVSPKHKLHMSLKDQKSEDKGKNISSHSGII